MGSLGPLELIVLLAFALAPFFILLFVAVGKNASPAYALWGLLGVIGLIIGLILLAIRREPVRRGSF